MLSARQGGVSIASKNRLVRTSCIQRLRIFVSFCPQLQLSPVHTTDVLELNAPSTRSVYANFAPPPPPEATRIRMLDPTTPHRLPPILASSHPSRPHSRSRSRSHPYAPTQFHARHLRLTSTAPPASPRPFWHLGRGDARASLRSVPWPLAVSCFCHWAPHRRILYYPAATQTPTTPDDELAGEVGRAGQEFC